MKGIEIHRFDGIGYQKLFHYQSWRIAILNYIDELLPENIHRFQAHDLTDEAFVLLEGACTLFIIEQGNIVPIHMEPNQIYNIKKGVFHSHTLSKNCKLLIIEEENTADDNSPCLQLTLEQRKQLIELARMNHGL
jgi:ureidoglycolate hydrolase